MARHAPSILAALAVLAGSLAPGSAYAAPLLTGLGGPADFGEGNLPSNDDGSTDEIDVRAAFPDGLRFFGMTFFSLYLNNNGNITFGGPLGTFTPAPFPIASQRMIAPWWGDVDTNGGGDPFRNGVYWDITPGRFVATWHDVGYFASHDDLQNDFQLILTTAGPGVGDFDVEFRYNQCEWTTGDASGGSGGFGGTPAQAGFDAGNLMDFIVLPGSRTMAVLDLCTTSNVGRNGVWRFEIRGGEVMCPGRGDACETGLPGVCGPGVRRCISPEASECVSRVRPSEETCDGADDDCDRRTDEELGSSTCGVGRCVTTVANCVGGTPQTCVPLPPQEEVCDRVDDDCDGVIDDLPPLTCGIGACLVTMEACIDGRLQRCVPGEPSVEVCNGYDDDCDGRADDGLDACFARPDAGPPDAGRRDGGTLDAGPVRDGGGIDACVGRACNPWQLDGRAGPIGCGCRAGAVRSPSPLLVLGMLVAWARRRRR